MYNNNSFYHLRYIDRHTWQDDPSPRVEKDKDHGTSWFNTNTRESRTDNCNSNNKKTSGPTIFMNKGVGRQRGADLAR